MWRQTSKRSTKSQLSEYITAISPANRKWMAEWQFKTQQGKNIPRPTGPLYERCLFYCSSVSGCWCFVADFIAAGTDLLIPASFYGSPIRVAGHELLGEQAKYNDLLNTCIWAHRGKEKGRRLMLKVLLIYSSCPQETLKLHLINTEASSFFKFNNDLIQLFFNCFSYYFFYTMTKQKHLFNVHTS